MTAAQVVRCGLAAAASLCVLSGAAKEKDTKTGSAPKAGVKTPGVQIPFSSLKAESDFATEGPVTGFAFLESVVIANQGKTPILRIAPKTNKPVDPIAGVAKPCGGLVSAFKSLWTLNCADKTITRLDPKDRKVTATIPIGGTSANPAVAATGDSVWILSDDKTTLSRVDPEQNAIVSEIRLPAGCNSIASGEGSLWVTCPKEGKVLRIDPKTNLVDKRIETAAQPIAITFGEGSAWILCKTEGKVAKVDPKSNKVASTIDLNIPSAAGNIAFGDGSIWVTAPGFPLTRINPQTDKVEQQFWGDGGGWLASGSGSVWLANEGKGTVWRLDPKRIVATLAE